MENEIIYEQDPRVAFDYCRWNTEEQVMLKFIADLKSFADKFPNLSENCGMGITTEEKVKEKMLVSELNKENRNRDVIVLDTIGKI